MTQDRTFVGERVIKPPKRFVPFDFRELWAYRELFGFLAWRDIAVRYKQSALGVAWALFTPLITMALFTVIFGRVAKIPTDGVPYPIFSFSGLLPWLFFAQAVQLSTQSMVLDRNLLTKVYFPRVIVPMSATLGPMMDFLIAFTVLGAMMVWYQVAPTIHMLYLVPACLLWAWLTAVGVGLWFSALNVYFRDVGFIIPFFIQVWMYISPVVYPASMFPEKWRWIYGLNPMAGVIEGFRWSMLSHGSPPGIYVLVSITVSIVLFVSGIYFFRRMDRTFADVV